MKTMKQEIIDLRTDWISGKWVPDRNCVHWGGAGLIVTDKPWEDDVVVVVTQYAGEVSSLIEALRDRLWDHINYISKYEFYPRLGKAANRYIAKDGDNLIGMINEILGEAGDIADEWE